MKTIFWVILLTTTTWYDGTPDTRDVGIYSSREICEENKLKLLKKYRENFPEGQVHVVEINCVERKKKK